MKILILTVTAGGGHNSTASALRKRFEESGADVSETDMFEVISKPIKHIIARGYLFSTEKLKKPYAAFYRMGEKRKANSYKPSISRFAYFIMSRKIRLLIEKTKPDAIVYTHVFCGFILDVIKQKHGLIPKCVGVVTDFAMHPYWEETLRLDYVVTPNELIYPAASRKGYSYRQVLPFGIPIREEFSVVTDKATARRELGLDEKLTTIMFMSGSMGHSNLCKVVKELDSLDMDIQIICVCGNNKKAKKKIDALNMQKPLLNLGFTDKVPLLMDASDCIVTKPGGLTSSEALAKRLPIIICNPIAGQEDRNSEFLLNCGVALRASPTCSVSYAIYQLFYNKQRIESIKECIELIRKPDSTKNVCDFVLNLIEKTDENIT